MEIRPVIEGFEDQNIVVKSSLLSGTKLTINDQKPPKGQSRGEMALTRNDGRVVSAMWKPQMLGFDTPQLVVDGKPIQLVEPLKWQELAFAGLPLILVFIGGLLGAIVGVLAFTASTSIFRSGINKFSKYALSGLITILAVLIYLVLASAIQLAINSAY